MNCNYLDVKPCYECEDQPPAAALDGFAAVSVLAPAQSPKTRILPLSKTSININFLFCRLASIYVAIQGHFGTACPAVAAARPPAQMQDVRRELPGLINGLLQSPSSAQRRLVETHYTPSCRLTHALCLANNREEIVRIFQTWRFSTGHLEAEIHDIILDASGSKVAVFFTQTIDSFMHIPGLSFSLTMSTILYLTEPSPSGGRRIYKQVDYHSFESILYHTPLIGAVLERGLRALLSWQLTRPAAAAEAAWPAVEAMLQRWGVPMGKIKDAATRVWWYKERKFKGRRLAPYDPAL